MDIVTYALLNGKIKDYASNVDEWLEENVDPDTGYVLDRSLQMENAAAPADMVGDINNDVGNLRNTLNANMEVTISSYNNVSESFYKQNTFIYASDSKTYSDTKFEVLAYVIEPNTIYSIKYVKSDDFTFNYDVVSIGIVRGTQTIVESGTIANLEAILVSPANQAYAEYETSIYENDYAVLYITNAKEKFVASVEARNLTYKTIPSKVYPIPKTKWDGLRYAANSNNYIANFRFGKGFVSSIEIRSTLAKSGVITLYKWLSDNTLSVFRKVSFDSVVGVTTVNIQMTMPFEFAVGILLDGTKFDYAQNAIKTAMLNDDSGVITPDFNSNFSLAFGVNYDSVLYGLSALDDKNSDVNCITESAWKLLDSVGVIGDSLSSGEFHYLDSNNVDHYGDFFDVSYPHYMGKDSGNTYVNLSHGGLTVLSWQNMYDDTTGIFTDTFGHQTDVTDFKAFMIALGMNDSGDTVGTSDDIDFADYHNNAQTFYGGYAKIIQQMQSKVNGCKIFALTVPTNIGGSVIQPTSRLDKINAAIRTIASLFDNVYVVDLYKNAYLFTNPLVINQIRANHFNAMGYRFIASIMEKCVNDTIVENYMDFRTYELIGTDWHWNYS